MQMSVKQHLDKEINFNKFKQISTTKEIKSKWKSFKDLI